MAGGCAAFDLATTTGWAYGRLPRLPLTPLEAKALRPPKPLSGTVRFGREGASHGAFMQAAFTWFERFFTEHRPAGLIIEDTILPADTNILTIRRLNGLYGLAHMMAHRHGVRWIRGAAPSSVKKHFCGSGRPGKDGVLEECRARGWAFSDDNEADALALLDFAASLAATERLAA